MKNKIRVLAIVGAVLAVLSAVLSASVVFSFVKFGELAPPNGFEGYTEALAEPIPDYEMGLFIPAVLCVLGAAIGAIAAGLAGKRAKASGVLLIIAGVISIFTVLGIVPMILFIIAAVFAFSPNAQSASPAVPSASGLKNASVSLCIIGSVFAGIASFLGIVSLLILNSSYQVIESSESALGDMYLTQLIFFVLVAVGTVFGIISAAKVRKDTNTAGVLMVIAAALCINTFWYIPTALFTVGAVLKFIDHAKQSRSENTLEGADG